MQKVCLCSITVPPTSCWCAPTSACRRCVCVALQYLQHRAGVHLPVRAEGVFVYSIYPPPHSELAGGSVKASLAACKALRRHYTAGPSPPTNGHSKRSFQFSSLDKEDMSVLSWLGESLHRTVTDYDV